MDEKNQIRIDVVGNVDGLKKATTEAERELDRVRSSAQRLGSGMSSGLQRDMDATAASVHRLGGGLSSGLQRNMEAVAASSGTMGTAMSGAAREASALGESAAASGASLEIMSSMAGLAATGMVVLAGATLATVRNSAKALEEVDKLSQRMGESVETTSELRFAFRMAGAEAEEMGGAFKSLESKMIEATDKTSKAGRAYEAMGVSVQDTNGKLKSGSTLLSEVADKMSGYQDGARKNELVTAALGDSWVKLIPLLNGGAAGIKSAADEAARLGVVYDEKLAKMGADFNDNLTKLKTAAEGAGVAFSSNLIPSLTDTATEMTNLIAQGNTLLAVLRGFAGVGKLPFDYFMGPSKADLSVDRQVADLKKNVEVWERDISDRNNSGGLVGRWLYGKPGELEGKIGVAKNQIAALQQFKDKIEKPAAAAAGGDKPKVDAPTIPDKPKPARSGGGAKVSDYERTMQSLAEKIAVENMELESTTKLTAAEREHAKWLADVDSGRKKLTKSQFEAAEAEWQEYLALTQKSAAHKELIAAIERQEETNRKGYVSMLDRIQKAKEETEVYGLTEAQISAVEQARLRDALAMARENGATEEQLAPLREEIALRGQLTEALAARDSKKYEIEDAKKSLSKDGDELDEFAKKAAGNMQTAMAEFFINPTKDGIQSIGQTFSQTLQKMIAEAGSAQLLKLMFGDMGKTGDVGGWVGSLIKGVSGGGGGGFGSVISGLFGGGGGIDWGSYVVPTWHDGGMVTPGGQTSMRMVPAGTFAGAPRFHGGGMAGLAANEVPAILQRGERVLTREQQQGIGGVTNMNQTLVFNGKAEPAQVRRAAASAARSVLGLSAGAARYG